MVKTSGRAKITRATVDAAWKRRAPDHRHTVRDTVCPGLTLVVGATATSWTFEYKPRGIDSTTGKRFPSRTVTLGTPESLSPDAARAKANELKGRHKGGTDL